MALILAGSRGALVAYVAAAAVYITSWQLGEHLRHVRASVPPTEERLFVPDPRTARFMSAGYNELAADLVWARTLVYYGDGMANDFSMQDVEPLVEVVNALDPYFRKPYLWGAYATTFRQKAATLAEFRASVDILERGAKMFPEDWELAWMLGLRYFADLTSDDPVEQRQLKEIGVTYIEHAMRMPGAPPDLPTLAAALRGQLGQHERALRELREMILATDPGPARDKLIARYQQLSSESQALAIRAASEDFDARWKHDMPFVPSPMYVLVGPPLPERSAAQLLEMPTFLGPEAEAESDEASEPQPPPPAP